MENPFIKRIGNIDNRWAIIAVVWNPVYMIYPSAILKIFVRFNKYGLRNRNEKTHFHVYIYKWHLLPFMHALTYLVHEVLLYYTEVHWLSRGQAMKRLYEFREEMSYFLIVKEVRGKELEFLMKHLQNIFD